MLVDIENCGDYLMSPSDHRYGLFETHAKCQHDLFLSVLGMQSSHFDQPVLSYKCWCRDVLYNISGLKLMLKYFIIYTTNNTKGLVGALC